MTEKDKIIYITGLVDMGVTNLNLELGNYYQNLGLEYKVVMTSSKSFRLDARYISDFTRVPVYVDDTKIPESYEIENIFSQESQTFSDFNNTQLVWERLSNFIEELATEYTNNTQHKT